MWFLLMPPPLPMAFALSLVSSLTDRSKASLVLLALLRVHQCSHLLSSGKERRVAALILRIFQSLCGSWFRHGPPMLSCCWLAGWLAGCISFPGYCASWQAGPAGLSSLRFAWFLYSLTRSGGGLSFINGFPLPLGALIGPLWASSLSSFLLAAASRGWRDHFLSQNPGVICHPASN